jgi:hypothetical protein
MNKALSHIELANETFEVVMKSGDLAVRKEEIERSLGYPEGKIPSHFADMIDNILTDLPNRCDIRGGYRILDFKKPSDRSDGVVVGGKFFKTDKIVTGQLRKSEKAILFVCTIGSEMEAWSREQLKEGDSVVGHIVDTVASAAVENATDVLHDFIGERMLVNGLQITNRYSPGYCNWSVSEQHLLFSFLPQRFCGITLSDSALMVPIKSVSGIIGAGREVKRVEYFCNTCGMKDCTYRASRLARAKLNTVDPNL